VSSWVAELDLAEQLSAIERAQERAREAAAESARWNGVYLVLMGIFMGAWTFWLRFTPPPPAVGLPFLACWLGFILLGPRMRGTARRHWRRASLVALAPSLLFYVPAFAISLPQSQFGLRIVGSSPAFWIPVAVLSALPPVIVGLWEARPRRAPSPG
jgi:hypothetical protein